jgi:hypothetical protein
MDLRQTRNTVISAISCHSDRVPTGDCQNEDLRVSSDRNLKLKFLGSKVTTDAGLLAYRELDETLGLTNMGGDTLGDSRLGKNKQHNPLGRILGERIGGPTGISRSSWLAWGSCRSALIRAASEWEMQTKKRSEAIRWREDFSLCWHWSQFSFCRRPSSRHWPRIGSPTSSSSTVTTWGSSCTATA